MARPAIRPRQAEKCVLRVPAGTDLVEWYFEQGWTDGLPVVPPTRALVDAFVEALGGDPQFVECKVPPRHGSLTREVLAINMVDRKSTRLNSSHSGESRMPSSA